VIDLRLGDCLEVLRTLDAGSVDAVVTDPPYGLSEGVQNRGDRLYGILRKIGLPDLHDFDSQTGEGSKLPSVSIGSPDLRRANGAVRVNSRVGVPEGAIDLDDEIGPDQEIDKGAKAAGGGIADRSLTLVADANSGQFLGDFILDLGDLSGAGSSDLSGGSEPEFFAGGFAVPIFAETFAGFPGFDPRGFPIVPSDDEIRIDDNPCGQAKRPTGVVALPRTVNTLMLRFDLGGRPLELRATYRTGQGTTLHEFGSPKLIRTLSAASRLASVAEPCRVSVIVPGTNGADSRYWFHLWMPSDIKVKSIIPRGGFMGKAWDAVLPDPEVWRECYRVMKPGSYLMAFGGTRTFHRLICSIEDAGFEIRDCLMWMYGSGFPKGKGCLKPAWEPITLARKPGGKIKPLGIEGCRVPAPGGLTKGGYHWLNRGVVYAQDEWTKANMCERSPEHPDGRWPPNLLLQHHPECNGECHPECVVRVLGEQSGQTRPGYFSGMDKKGLGYQGADRSNDQGQNPSTPVGDSGTAARFFPQFRYEAKASRQERGLDNTHPTVKPLVVMEWLVRLACPEGGTVLDSFMGSGTTGVACKRNDRSFIGIDDDPEWLSIAQKRLAAEQAKMSLFAGIEA
jgi:DNA modification methylase